MAVIDLLRGVHIAAGSLALVSLWVPLVSRKGGSVHRRAGRVFVISMAVLTLAAIGASVWRLTYDTDPERRTWAAYLLFVAVLSGSQVSAGVRALRGKARTGPQLHAWDVGIALLLLGSAVAVFAWGLRAGIPLFIGFAPVGIAIGSMQLAYWLRPPRNRMHWFFEHMFMMIGAGIGTLSAFSIVNAQHLGLRPDSLILWNGPTVLGLAAWAVWRVYYGRLFRRQEKELPRAA
jgi:hypothetical protein